jgi:hypothetical protein
MEAIQQKYWVLTADMGYGHQRATNPFSGVARHRIINMNNDAFTPKAEQKYWERALRAYEFMSRAGKIPLIGGLLFRLLNLVLHIPKPKPGADFSKPTYQVKLLKMQIKRGLCRGVINTIKNETAPVLTSFYAPAIAAELAGVKDSYCIICDSDLNRVWVSENPRQTAIKYFTPCREASARLKLYGVPEMNIIQTGFPLHPDLLGSKDLEIVKADFCNRLHRLYPKNRGSLDVPEVCKDMLKNQTVKPEPLTLSFAVGGAGAQTEQAAVLMNAFEEMLISGKLRINLIAGVRKEVSDYFKKLTDARFGDAVKVIFENKKDAYFKAFNRSMRTTDLLVTKPSELSFYAGLGLPLLLTPSLGSQEEYNRKWLLSQNAAIDLPQQGDLAGWFRKKLDDGTFARLAVNGFQNIEKSGYYNILDHLNRKHFPASK